MGSDDLPYKAEYAKSSRASCRGCKSTIQKETLRLAVMIQSPMFDGKMAHWYHVNCFFMKQRPKTAGDIEDFANLRYDDQKKIKEKIETLGSVVVPTKGKGKKRQSEASGSNAALKDFNLEYAKSGRAMCRGCEQKILKDEIRISKKDFETEVGKKYGGQDMWHHLECFAKLRTELRYFETGAVLPGFHSLSIEDKEKVKMQLPAIKQEEVAVKKPKLEDEVDGKSKDDSKIKKQNEVMYDYRDKLQKKLNKKELILLLEYNDQEIPSGESRILDRLSDIMTFGALEKCEKCKGQLVFEKNSYVCTGNLTEWAKCQDRVEKPKRRPFKVPNELKEEYSFLAKYKYVPRTRIFENLVSTVSVKKEEKDEVDHKPKVDRPRPALENMQFTLTGIKHKKDLVKEITKLGGKVVKDPLKCSNEIMACISTKKLIEKSDDYPMEIECAKKYNYHVVTEDFVTEAKNFVGKIPELILKKNICSWGSDPTTRLPKPELTHKSKSSKSIYTKSVPKSVTMRIKGGLAVDPDSGLEDKAHVYQKGQLKYTAVLGLTDIQAGKNSFYKLQLLESDKKNRYWVFRAWGRISTTIGGNKLEECSNVYDAIKLFEDLYLEKSGNKFRDSENFVKVPGKMYPIDVDYDQGDENSLKIHESNVPSKLKTPVQDLVRLIFDVDSMKKTMLEFELDMEKMPLGKLSKKQITKAFGVLSELQTLIDQNADSHRFIDASNRFYTFIPHSFGIDDPPILNNHDIVKEKLDMLDSLLELEIAYSLMKGCKEDKNSNNLDQHYEKLNTEIDVLDKDSEEFKLIEDYVKNTHAETHSHYQLEIDEVFAIKRQGEDKRFKPFKKLPNHKLLWHGSRTTNYAGILAQGLRIAPPEAPVTGYMFGKGIYFADMVSKSANYCCTTQDNNTGLMLLCDVALGNIYERTQADYIEKLPAGKHSVKGIGMTEPDPSGSVVKDGIEIPLGKGQKVKGVKSTLLYNEYIVYDIAQVNVKYLLKMKFKYL